MLTLNVMKQPIDQSWSIERITTEAPPITWEKVFEDAKAELQDVSSILDEQEKLHGQYYPLKKDIFAAFQYTTLNNVKVVILGQDPYHQTININGISLPRAVGLSFSVRREDNIPSSLQNIYIELANTVRGFTKPEHGDLREWARQGILLLNTCLTVHPGQPGSHGDIWLGFINKVFKAIAAVNPYCIYILWGREAQKVKPMLGERSIILEAAHPSGLSAKRGFFGCNHFNMANEALIRQGKIGINWKISSLSELNAPVNSNNSSLITHMEHRPILAPVNTELLPSIIPVVTVPHGNSKTKESQSGYISGPLPIIPNIKPISSSTPQLPAIINTKPKSPPVPQTNNEIPRIPTIHFNNNLNIKLISSETDYTSQIKQPVIISGISDLPIIPTLIK